MVALDKRESGYTRELIDLENIERVNDLLVNPESDNEAAGDNYYKDTFLEDASSIASGSNPLPKVWVYIPDDPKPATAHYPILQSYVDICMRGCLSISPLFLQEFLMSTYGWHPEEMKGVEERNGNDGYNQAAKSDFQCCWWDDRRTPIYTRADKSYSLENCSRLDSCLEHAQLPVETLRV
ncbi:MAG: hypothetical protein SGILL_005618 [Bacillariaceae sp.]